jgi:hypothetical protein
MAKAKQTKTDVAPAEGETTETTTAPAGQNMVEAAKARAAAAQKDIFKRILVDGKGVAPVKKLAPQAMTIINTIEAAGEAGISRTDLVAALPAAGLVTRQPVGRILAYYQKDVVAQGAVEIVKGA